MLQLFPWRHIEHFLRRYNLGPHNLSRVCGDHRKCLRIPVMLVKIFELHCLSNTGTGIRMMRTKENNITQHTLGKCQSSVSVSGSTAADLLFVKLSLRHSLFLCLSPTHSDTRMFSLHRTISLQLCTRSPSNTVQLIRECINSQSCSACCQQPCLQ